MTLQGRLEIPVLAPGRRTVTLRRNGLPAPAQLGGALLGYSHLSLRERLAVGRAALALGRVDVTRDDVTLGSWLAAHGQSREAVAKLWDLIALPTLNVPAREGSLGLGAFVFQEGLLSSAGAGDVGMHDAPLSEVIGRPAARALQRAGVAVKLRWRAVGVQTRGAGFAVQGEGETLAADAVVLAVQHYRAGALLPAELGERPAWAEGLGSSPIVNVHVVYDRRVLEHRFAAGVDTPVQYVFDRTPASWSDGRQYVAVSLSAADAESAMRNQEIAERYLPALAELLPRAAHAQVLRVAVTREHAATFRAIPGTAALRPQAQTDLPGFALAGAWTATGWPATLEGAVRSGHAAAAAISQ